MPEPVGQPAGQVVVGPAHAVHDLQRASTAPSTSPRGAGVVGAPAHHLVPHVERLGRRLVARAGARCAAPTPMMQGCAGSTAISDPASSAVRFSANAFGPSLASSVAKTSATAPVRSCRPRSACRPGRAARDSLVACTASGRVGAGCGAPTRRPGPSARPGSTISLMQARARARARPGTASAVSRNSIAAGNGDLPRQPDGRAAAGEQTPLGLHHAEGALGVAMRMSMPPSISMPPATHGPSMAAMIGL